MRNLFPIYIIGLGLNRPGGRGETDGPGASAGDDPSILLPVAVLGKAEVLVGGRSQLECFSGHPAKKITAGADVRSVCEAVLSEARAGKRVVVLCSGDPLYFSFGGRLSEFLRGCGWTGGLRLVPAVSSLQAACAILGFSQQDVLSVSLHGRASYLSLAHALLVVEGRREAAFGGAFAGREGCVAAAGRRSVPAGICLLTDSAGTPERVAAFLAERGCTGYALHILDNLYTDAEGVARVKKRQCLSVRRILERNDAAGQSFPEEKTSEDAAAEKNGPPGDNGEQADIPVRAVRRVLFLEPVPEQGRIEELVFGLQDAIFQREKDLLTKQPVRAAGLAALGIAPHHLVWDLGSGSGAVAVEASRLAYQGRVVSVEEKAERVRDILANRRACKAANLEVVHARLPEALYDRTPKTPAFDAVTDAPDLAGVEALSARPHRIIIGGGLSGPGAEDILRRAWERLLPGGRLACHCVLLGSLETARRVLGGLGARLSGMSLQAAWMQPLAGDVRFEGMNPVFLVCAEKAADGEAEKG